MLQMRNSVHLNFDGNGDLLFDFFRGAPRPLRDNLHVVVGYVRIGFHGKFVERNCAPNEQQSGEPQDYELVVKGVIDERANHWLSIESG